MSRVHNTEHGYVNGWMVGTIGALVLFVVTGGLAIWAYMAYSQEKTAVDSRISVAEAKAREEQAATDREKFNEEAKNPRTQFVGPSEYGRVSFLYPKTWSVYVDRDGSDRGDYKAYLHPMSVPPIGGQSSRFALRLEILNSDFDKVLGQYASLLKKGDLTSSSVEFNGNAATRLDGAFSKDLRGSVVLMRVRDKTIRFSTDADTFKPDFATILATVTFVQ
ncbi:MAG: hypothetical protein Q4F02_02935 [Candidatus Saccharibacteria bacterium]|nr:hypothetical protein [Candidatus Saccharibacteria bacterium]